MICKWSTFMSRGRFVFSSYGSFDGNYLILTPLVQPTKHHYSVPLETVQTFTHREQLWEELERKLQIRHEKAIVPFAITLHGLGGAGKSQLALKYAESNAGRYNPILWIDATSEETVRSSFIRCAAEIGLPDEQNKQQSAALVDDRVIQGVLRWLRDRTELDDEWLFIVDNADDVTWGIKKIIPKGVRGRLLITSRDDQSQKLVDRGCEAVRVDVMSPQEARMVLLRHLSDDIDWLPKTVQEGCDNVATKLGYLPLAIDLAGAYIGNNSLAPEQSLTQYLKDYEKHRDELLQMNHLRGLSPTERTVWTVWDTTLEKIEREYRKWQPGVLLTLLAHFHGTVVQNEMFRLASLGMYAINDKLGEENFTELQMFISEAEGEWDDFKYRQSIDVLVRYSLVQRVHGEWPGTTMHSLVKWRATPRNQDQQWQWWYTKFVLAACSQITKEDHQPQFRRHLILHLPGVRNIDLNFVSITEMGKTFVWTILGMVHDDEGHWEEAEQLFVQAMETRKTKLGEDHPDTLTSMSNLASTYRNRGRWEEAEQLEVQVMETRKTKLGVDNHDTLTSMNNLSVTYKNQCRWEEAEQLDVQVMETLKTKLGKDYPGTLTSMGNLASTYMNQGRWEEAEQLFVQVMETHNTKLGKDYPGTLTIMGNLALTYKNQGRWEEAEQLEVQVMETRKTKLGEDHPRTLTIMGNLASTYMNQGRWEEAEQLEVQVMETHKTKLGKDHPGTLTIMGNLALTYKNQGRWEEAEQLEVQVMETRKTKLGKDHPYTLTSTSNLASTYFKQGRWEEAEQLEVQVMETRKTKLGVNHPDTLTSMGNLASTYRDQGRWEEAEQLEVQVMETRKTKLGEDHPDTLASMANLAFTWKFSGHNAEAINLLRDCLTQQKQTFGLDHPTTLSNSETLLARETGA
ncbi:hypothetical protein N7530_012717 [Penicillium desertorum]|uniref:NB-ARC domain-containing protein n=1 Tax=Penicillium desertorum TaxID=1303715 RepID=A0A9W9WDF1_9EURO|nr:hypothetical protein N7530_012717 [Penicillium desertorum]